MSLRQRLLNLVGIVALTIGMTTGIVYADTGTAQFEVMDLTCDPSNPKDTSVTAVLSRGNLDFGTVPAHGNVTVASASPLEVTVKAGCSSLPWAVGISASAFEGGTLVPSIPTSRLTLTAADFTYRPHPDAESYHLWNWYLAGFTIPFPGMAALPPPTQGQTVGFITDGGKAFLGSAALLFGSSPISCVPPLDTTLGATGTTVASWNAELDLTGQMLEPGASYQSVLTVAVSTSI